MRTFRLLLQGLDYWARVRWHHAYGEFQKFGYFPGAELNEQSPLLLVAPALRIHTATEWNLIAVDEHRRQEVKPVFRKRSKNSIE